RLAIGRLSRSLSLHARAEQARDCCLRGSGISARRHGARIRISRRSSARAEVGEEVQLNPVAQYAPERWFPTAPRRTRRSPRSKRRWRRFSPLSSWPGKSAKRVFALDDPAIHVFLCQ